MRVLMCLIPTTEMSQSCLSTKNSCLNQAKKCGGELKIYNLIEKKGYYKKATDLPNLN